jgi:hypothetical protein
MRALLTALLICVPQLVWACTGGREMALSELDATTWQQIETMASASRAEIEVYGSITAIAWDLDGNGAEEICILAASSLTCSNGVAVCMMLVLGDTAERRMLLDTATHILKPGETDAAGWQGLRALSYQLPGTPDLLEYFTYHDGRYQRVS